ncbi:hypothetical protein L3N51_01307 [Metallosphaera sp. J1]|uniref:HEPN domain-containing protein n=1 Tax=Metallosphaera javensis (ex Hofmann et al. 2022) TaxID=99938 RepID=UPI001EE084F6|nr:HEPN domain-containing protein [Metallosphaera javensis (ex Hofmann et al. 2022)]MCG3109017.1 hypothetical protein [Metallosphaera javensis (ex Hofmann et al. 2022)]
MVEKFWFDRSEEFLQVAERLFNEGYYWMVCFSSHQSVEFRLKGILVKNFGEYPFSHDLSRLLSEIQEKLMVPVPGPVFRDGDFLTPHYTISRYSQISNYDRRKAEECLFSARNLITFLKEKVEPLGID